MLDKTNTSDEILDLVDENDEIIGRVVKSEANQDSNLLHREIAVMIYDNQKRVLVQQRSKKKKVYPGYWTLSCAGHVPRGMDPLEAAHKELKEELGFDTNLVFVNKWKFSYPNETHFCYGFLGQYPNKTIIIDQDEVEQTRFASREEYFNLPKRTKSSNKMLKDFWEGKFNQKALLKFPEV